MGFSWKTLTERRPERPPVASRSLPAGIFTVRRRILPGLGGESGELRETVTEAVAAEARVCLVDLVLMLAGGLEGSSGDARGRRERRRAIVADEEGFGIVAQ